LTRVGGPRPALPPCAGMMKAVSAGLMTDATLHSDVMVMLSAKA
jgi:hypothetical protein